MIRAYDFERECRVHGRNQKIRGRLEIDVNIVFMYEILKIQKFKWTTL